VSAADRAPMIEAKPGPAALDVRLARFTNILLGCP
jgi:hypothetical protein